MFAKQLSISEYHIFVFAFANSHCSVCNLLWCWPSVQSPSIIRPFSVLCSVQFSGTRCLVVSVVFFNIDFCFNGFLEIVIRDWDFGCFFQDVDFQHCCLVLQCFTWFWKFSLHCRVVLQLVPAVFVKVNIIFIYRLHPWASIPLILLCFYLQPLTCFKPKDIAWVFVNFHSKNRSWNAMTPNYQRFRHLLLAKDNHAYIWAFSMSGMFFAK